MYGLTDSNSGVTAGGWHFSPGNFYWPTGKSEARKKEEMEIKTTEICFGSTKMGIFYWEKAFHAGKKIRKNDFVPSDKHSSYAPG